MPGASRTLTIIAKCARHGPDCRAWIVVGNRDGACDEAQCILISFLEAGMGCTQEQHQELADEIAINSNRIPKRLRAEVESQSQIGS